MKNRFREEREKRKRKKTYVIVGLLAELGVVLADEGVGRVVLGGLYFDAAALNVPISLSVLLQN